MYGKITESGKQVQNEYNRNTLYMYKQIKIPLKTGKWYCHYCIVCCCWPIPNNADISNRNWPLNFNRNNSIIVTIAEFTFYENLLIDIRLEKNWKKNDSGGKQLKRYKHFKIPFQVCFGDNKIMFSNFDFQFRNYYL